MKYVLLFVDTEEFARDLEAMGPARVRHREEIGARSPKPLDSKAQPLTSRPWANAGLQYVHDGRGAAAEERR
jgi:hypothetical protein